MDALTDLLFPNRHSPATESETETVASIRNLVATQAPPLPFLVVCETCTGLVNCPVLNQYRIEEVYLPNNLAQKGTCTVLDQLGGRVKGEVFGPGRTFRDTPQCRDIVMQYLCLFYGSNNYMYRNWCQFREDVTPANRQDYKVAPRYPCRSFCVQVATVCANDPLFMQLCANIACPPLEDDCTPNPSVTNAQGKQQDLGASIGCSMPYDLDPYSPKNSAPRPVGAAEAAWWVWAAAGMGCLLHVALSRTLFSR